MLASRKMSVKSGEKAPVSGYYVYVGNADPTTIPCNPTDKEKAIVLEEGQEAPYIKSCKDHAALYEMIVTKPRGL